MHRERVERHCKGVISSLNEFKTRFQEMMEEHDKEVIIILSSNKEHFIAEMRVWILLKPESFFPAFLPCLICEYNLRVHLIKH